MAEVEPRITHYIVDALRRDGAIGLDYVNRTRYERRLEPLSPQKWVALKTKLKKIDERAVEVLFRFFDATQQSQYRSNSWVAITASDGSGWALSPSAYSGNIRQLRSNRATDYVRSWCGHLNMTTVCARDSYLGYGDYTYIPLAEHHLAQVLCITTNVEMWRKTAL